MRRNGPGVTLVPLRGASFVFVAVMAAVANGSGLGQTTSTAASGPPPPFLHSRLITANEALAVFTSRFHARPGTVTADPKPDWYSNQPAFNIRGGLTKAEPGDADDGWVRATDGSILAASFNWPQQTRYADSDDPIRPISPQQGLKIAQKFVSHTYPDFARRRWLAPTPQITEEDTGNLYYFEWAPLVGPYNAMSWPPLDVAVDAWSGNIVSYGEPDRGAFIIPPPPLINREQALRLVRQYAPADPDKVATLVTLRAVRDEQGVWDLSYTVRQNIGQPHADLWQSNMGINAYTGQVVEGSGGFSGPGANPATPRKPLPTKPFIQIHGVTPVATSFAGIDGRPIISAEGVVQVAGAYYIRAEAFRALGARATVDSKHLEIAGNGFVCKPPLLKARKIYGGWWVDVLSTAKLLGWPGSYDAKTNTLHVESDPVSFKNPFKLVP